MIIAAAVALCTAAALLHFGIRLASFGTAYTAKVLCSGVFVSHRDPQSLLRTDLAADDLSVLRHIDAKIDQQSREVTADLFGLAKRKSVYREGCGCTLTYGPPWPAACKDVSSNLVPRRRDAMDELKPANGLLAGVERSRLDTALRWAFSEPDPASLRRTRAIVVVYKDRLVAERYADGVTEDTPLIGWSMTKSVVNALAGILLKEGKASLNDPAPIPAWGEPNDPRRRITLGQLLHMTSGLEFNEDETNPFADVTHMLLGEPDVAAYATAKPLRVEPGTQWNYSSGTTNILSYAIRHIAGESNYLEFPRHALFDRLGMKSAVMETDAAGTFVASSFMYATARDWARFGLLYLHDGVWSGERLLPEGWVKYTRTPAPNSPDRRYGAHFWLRIPKEYQCGAGSRPLPADAFHAVGHEGQFVTIIPSRELVLVRLGLTRNPCAWDHLTFTHLILQAIAGVAPANMQP